MTTFTKITAENLETITALDLREEAADSVAKGELVWFAQGEYGGVRTQVVAFDNGRAGLADGANAAWGDGDVIGDDGEADGWTLTLDQDGRRIDVNGREFCCYEGCRDHATHDDNYGDRCCKDHAAKSYEYVEIVGGDASVELLSDETIARRYVRAMFELGYTVEVRRARHGEATGTHLRNSDGTVRAYRTDSMDAVDSYKWDSEKTLDQLI